MFPLPLHIYFEAGALLSTLVLWPWLRFSLLRWFLPFLCFILFVELAGRYFAHVLHQGNGWLFNLSIPVEYLFYAFLFLNSYTKVAYRFLAHWFLILFPVFVFFTFLANGLSTFHIHVLQMGSFFMIVLSVLWFADFYEAMETEIIWEEPLFWIAAGVLLFNNGELSYNFFSDLLIRRGLDQTALLFKTINNNLILVLYSFLTIGFICQQTSGRYRTA